MRSSVSVENAKHLKGKMLTFFLALMLASVALTRVSGQQATVRVVPASYTVPNVGLTFSISVTVGSVENLFGYEFKLYYPSNILNGTSVLEGPFLKTGEVSTLFSVAKFTDNYNATHGLLNILSLRTAGNGVSGSGTLATITFKSTSTSGPRILHLADIALSDPNPAAIPFTAVDGEVTVIPEFPLALIPPLLVVSALVAITLGKKVNHRTIFHSV
jgi:hypothetical protein